MKRTALAMFVKTPGLSPIKTRLAATLGEPGALEFYHLAIKATTALMLSAQQQCSDKLNLFYAIDSKDALDNPLWQELKVIYSGDGNLGQGLAHVYTTLINQYDNVILIGADCPQLTVDRLLQTIQRLARGDEIIMGPSSDGGFYLFAGTKPIADSHWHNVTYSRQTTGQQLINNLKQADYHIMLLPTLTDVDEFTDLSAVLTESSPPLLPEQLAMQQWIKSRLN